MVSEPQKSHFKVRDTPTLVATEKTWVRKEVKHEFEVHTFDKKATKKKVLLIYIFKTEFKNIIN